MKHKNRFTDRIVNQVSERLPKALGAAKPVGFDIVLPALMATGLRGLVVATYDGGPEAENLEAENEDAANRQDNGRSEPTPLTPFSDPILPPLPRHQPSQRDIYNVAEGENLVLADLLPPVQPAGDIEWHHPLSQPTEHDLVSSVLSLPTHSALPEVSEVPKVHDETPPPLPSDPLEENEAVDMEEEEEEEAMAAIGQDSPVVSGGQHSPPAEDEMTEDEMNFYASLGGVTSGEVVGEIENWQEINGPSGITPPPGQTHNPDAGNPEYESEEPPLYEPEFEYHQLPDII